MALETATYISDLNTSNPSSTDSVAQADDHLRLIKAAVKATFPNITGPVTATQSQINQPIPTGLIVMWSGSAATIPSGWYLCNGQNGTPDLRNRFIVGAGSGSNYNVADTGGADSVTLTTSQIPSHTHTFTATTDSSGSHTHSITDPGHTHGYTGTYNTGLSPYPTGGGVTYQTGATTASATTGISVNSGGAHTHTLSGTSASTGSGSSHENRPPYYALCFIMKA